MPLLSRLFAAATMAALCVTRGSAAPDVVRLSQTVPNGTIPSEQPEP
jgi:hypothetical protein